MGKWATCTFPIGFDERFQELKELSAHHINDLWEQHGSLALGDFANMGWYWSQSNGWACIDNCEGKNPPANFKIFCKYSDHINDDFRINFEKLAVVLACEFHMPREVVVITAKPEEKTITKPIGCNLNMIVEGSTNRPSLQLHLFKGRYGGGVVAFMCSTEEQAEKIIDHFTGGDSQYGEASNYFGSAPWFPIVYADDAVEAIELLLDHTNKDFVEADIRQWTKAVDRMAGTFLSMENLQVIRDYVRDTGSLLSDLNAYMEGW